VRGALGFRQKHAGRERQEKLKRKKTKVSFFPCCTLRGRRKRNNVAQNNTILLFFFEKHETASFWTKRAVSFKYGANMSTSKSVLNLSFVHFNCIPVNFNRRPYSWPPFSLWSLVSNLCNLVLN
jgi:hypothetical protein